jgi:hypothetical protein
MKPAFEEKPVMPRGNAASVDSVLAYCQAQEVLFVQTLSRLSLQGLDLPPKRTGQLRANVKRSRDCCVLSWSMPA